MEKGLVEYRARDGQDLKLTFDTVRKYLVRGKGELVTEQELMYFMGVCKSRGMNPFINDCYLIKYTANDAAAIITSIDYYRKRARAQTDCQGWHSGVIIREVDGNVREREGSLILEGETLVGGWFSAQPKSWTAPMKWTVGLKGYVKKTREGAITRFWAEENQPAQIAKVAESQGLRKVWPDEFQGLYVDAEMQSHEAQNVLNEVVSSPDRELEKTPQGPTSFTSLIPPEADKARVKEYVTYCSEAYKTTPAMIEKRACKDWTKFWSSYQKWVKPDDKPQPVSPGPHEPEEVPPGLSPFLTEMERFMNALPAPAYNRVLMVAGFKSAEEVDEAHQTGILERMQSELDAMVPQTEGGK
jgi:phage recombination protein Bet